MYDQWDDEPDYINVKEIEYLYELRHACNLFGNKSVAQDLHLPVKRINDLYNSDVHGSKELKQFFIALDEEFIELINKYEQESFDKYERIRQIQDKNEQLVDQLRQKREQFANVGTNKAKRRLNKLALTNPVAEAVRLALEIEDKNISAKKSYGIYQEKIYDQKNELILNLCKLFKKNKWTYGIQESENPPTSHVIYFEIPNCDQISWHFTPKKASSFPNYKGIWDKKINATLGKLEIITLELLKEIK